MLPPAIRLIVRLIAAAIAALSIALAILAWRLSSGPISLTLLTPYLQDALNRGGMTLRVEVLDTALAWAGRDRTLELQAKEVRLINAEGRPVAVLPQLSLALSGAALLRGLVAPETLDLLASRLRVIRTAAGHFRVDTTQEGSVIDLTAMKEILSPPDPERASGYLRRISALDADITFRDEATGTQWRLRQADLVLLRDHSGVHGDLSGQLEQGAGPPAEIGARGSLDEPGARIEIDMRFAGVRPPHLASANAPLAPLAAAAMVFSGTAQLVVGLDGTLSEVTLVVASEQPGTFTLAKEFAEPIPLASAAARVRIAPGFDRITIDEVRLEADDTEATFVGELRRTADGPDVVLHAAIARLRVDDLPRYWPLAVGPLAREWFATNIAGGLITTATMDLALPPSVFAHAPIPAGGVAIAFAFEGASGRYFMGFPPITNAAGSGTLTEAELRTEIHSGRIGAIALSEGVAVITGVNQPQARASFDLVGRGGLGDFVALLDRPPLDLAAKLDLDRDALAGKVAARARFVMPVKRGLTPGEVNYAAAANTQGVALGEVFAGYALTDGDLEVRIGRDGIAASGEAALNGVPLTVRWRRDLAASGAPDTYELSGRLDDQGRAALNLATGAYLTGPILAAATARAQAGALIEASAQLDLAAAVVTVPELRWAKPAGTPGTVAFSVSGGAEGGFLVRDIAASLGDLTAAGEVAIASGPRFERATLKSVRFGSNDFAASLRPIPGGGLVIGASGARFDLRPFSDDLFDFEERGDLPPLRLNAQFDRL
ncbi:MAG: hypothetical protein FJX56_03775, partial [Alphaproteobacteria bacterium]|nr:hypothetical protein [Alphaproteobacteria bacterium]